MVSETALKVKPLPKRRAWQRLEGESPEHFDLFAVYRDLPKNSRTVEKSWQAGDRSKGLQTLRDLCARFHWVERAIAFDDFIADQAATQERYERLASLRRMRRRHREHGDALMGKAMGWLRAHPQIESVKDAVALVRLALELETSGHVYDPTPAFVSGDIEQTSEQTETRRLAIEIFGADGKTIAADDLRATMMAFYDQKPPGYDSAKELPINLGAEEKTQQEVDESALDNDGLDGEEPQP